LATALLLLGQRSFGQTDTTKKDTSSSDCSSVHFVLQPDNYKKFKKSNCEKQYCGSKKAQDLFCEAKYNISQKEYNVALSQLFCAYKEAKCKEFKFQIIKTTQQLYVLKGDSVKANQWQQRVDTILKINPNIDKH
jgi:hypothetical protein